MTTEEKYNLAMEIASKEEFPKDMDTVKSIADNIKNNRFFIEYVDGKMVVFLTWEYSMVDEKRYVFVNNLWIKPTYRSYKTLLKVRTALKYLLNDVYKFYWFDKKKQKVIYRR